MRLLGVTCRESLRGMAWSQDVQSMADPPQVARADVDRCRGLIPRSMPGNQAWRLWLELARRAADAADESDSIDIAAVSDETVAPDVAAPPADVTAADDVLPAETQGDTEVCDPAGVAAANGTACDDGSACTVGDTCLNGKCSAGKSTRFGKNYGTPGKPGSCGWPQCPQQDMGTAVLGVADGVVAVATTYDATGASAATILRIDATGTVLWTKKVDAATYGSVDGIGAAGAGSVLCGWKSGTLKTNGSAVRLGDNGGEVWAKSYTAGDGGGGFRATVGLADGIALAGYASVGGKSRGWLVRTGDDGAVLWQQTYGDAAIAHSADAIALVGDGFALAGVSQQNTQKLAWMVRTDTSGQPLWSQTYGVAGTAAKSLAVVQDGFALAGTSLAAGNVPVMWLQRTDAAGAPLWAKTFGELGSTSASQGGDATLAGMVALPDGFVLSGDTKAGGFGTQQWWLVKTDVLGNTAWKHDYPCGFKSDPDFACAPNTNTNVAGLTSSGTGFAMVGTLHDSMYADDLWLVVTDAWGHATCASAGTCSAKPAGGCDDANACTADLCDGKLGCQHANLADGLACGAGQACSGGVCK